MISLQITNLLGTANFKVLPRLPVFDQLADHMLQRAHLMFQRPVVEEGAIHLTIRLAPRFRRNGLVF